MGPIQDTYLRFESAGDQYVGRVVSGLPLSSSKFAAMPPEYGTVEDGEIAFDLFPNLPQHMNRVARYLGSSLLFALPKLRIIMPLTHPFFQISVLTSSRLLDITTNIRMTYAWDDDNEVSIEAVNPATIEQQHATMLVADSVPPSLDDIGDGIATARRISTGGDTILKATGIPVHVLLLAEMKKVILAQKDLINDLRGVVSSELDKRELGSAPFQLQKSVEDLMNKFQESITKKIDDALPSSEQTINNTNVIDCQKHGSIFNWGGKWRRVPEKFTFPLDMGLQSAWTKYFAGEQSNKIGPFRNIKICDLNVKLNKYGRDRIHSFHRLINFMIEECKRMNYWFEDPTNEQIKTMYQKVSPLVFSLCKNLRAETFKWNTLSRKVYVQIKQSKQ